MHEILSIHQIPYHSSKKEAQPTKAADDSLHGGTEGGNRPCIPQSACSPTGTRFNRKMLMILGSAAGACHDLLPLWPLSNPTKDLTPREQAEAAKKPSTTTNYAPTPEAISTAPRYLRGLEGLFRRHSRSRRGDIPGDGEPFQTRIRAPWGA